MSAWGGLSGTPETVRIAHLEATIARLTDANKALTAESDHWISENRRILKAGQDAAYKLDGLSSAPQPKGNASRYHLTEPTVEIDGKMFGKGWLLISEEEYASLVASPPPSGTVEIERYAIQDLRAWGCKCHKPLLGWRHGQGPRCRICNAERPATADGWRDMSEAKLEEALKIIEVAAGRLTWAANTSDKHARKILLTQWANEAHSFLVSKKL